MKDNKQKSFCSEISIYVDKQKSDCEVSIVSFTEILLIHPENMDIIVTSNCSTFDNIQYLIYDKDYGIVRIDDKNMKRDTSFIKTKEEARSMYIAFKNGDWDSKKNEIINNRKTINLKFDKEINDSNLLKVIEAITKFGLIDVDDFKIGDSIPLSEEQRTIAQMFFEQRKRTLLCECEIQTREKEKNKDTVRINQFNERLGKSISECADKTKQIQDLQDELSKARKFEDVLEVLVMLTHNVAEKEKHINSINRSSFTEFQNLIIDYFINPPVTEDIIKNTLNKLNIDQERSRQFKNKEIIRLLEFAKSLEDIKGPELFNIKFNSDIDNLKQIGDIIINLRQGQEELKGDELNRIHNLYKLVEDYPKFIEKESIDALNKNINQTFDINDDGEFTHYYNEVGNKYIQLAEENRRLKDANDSLLHADMERINCINNLPNINKTTCNPNRDEIVRLESIIKELEDHLTVHTKERNNVSNFYSKKLKEYDDFIKILNSLLNDDNLLSKPGPNVPFRFKSIIEKLCLLRKRYHNCKTDKQTQDHDDAVTCAIMSQYQLNRISLIEKDNEIKKLKEEVEVHRTNSADRFKTIVNLTDEITQNRREIQKLEEMVSKTEIKRLEAIMKLRRSLNNYIGDEKIASSTSSPIKDIKERIITNISSFNEAMRLIKNEVKIDIMDLVIKSFKNEIQKHNCSLEILKTIDLVNMFIFFPTKSIDTIIEEFKRDFIMEYPSNLPNFFYNNYTGIFKRIITTINLFYFFYLINNHRLHMFNITNVFFDCINKQDSFLDIYHDYVKDQYKPFIKM